VTVLEVIRRGTGFLEKKGVDSPRLQVELLLAHIRRVPRLKLYLDFERELSVAEEQEMRELLKRRARREPLQYLLGTVSFCGLELVVNRDVLVPRPETESLAERAWEFLNLLPAPSASPRTWLDCGTGSGCLAVALAVKSTAARGLALDISEAALAVARENAARHQVAGRVRFVQSDGFANVPRGPGFDLIVANPPYIPGGEIAGLAPEVRDHEPRVALDGGVDGLDFFRRLAGEAPAFLAAGGRLLVEFSDGQERSLPGLFAAPVWTIQEIAPDLGGRPRIMVASRCHS
jgi:release factor glutamine methyltransferase